MNREMGSKGGPALGRVEWLCEWQKMWTILLEGRQNGLVEVFRVAQKGKA